MARTIQPAYGDIYDAMGVVYEYEDGRTIYSFSRQQSKCFNEMDGHLLGTKGRAAILIGIITGENEYRQKKVPSNKKKLEHEAPTKQFVTEVKHTSITVNTWRKVPCWQLGGVWHVTPVNDWRGRKPSTRNFQPSQAVTLGTLHHRYCRMRTDVTKSKFPVWDLFITRLSGNSKIILTLLQTTLTNIFNHEKTFITIVTFFIGRYILRSQYCICGVSG
ncbi:MAG: hypothetical protein LBE12_13405 [Planctomycetaceae bacterium]|jgi:hypothetical protein|nr:hypothetical protein [Planctomycetaceae bacterium]